MDHPFFQIEQHLHLSSDFADFFASQHAIDLGKKIVSRMAQIDTVSFDVFDTVLLRNGISELARFLEISTRFVAKAQERDPEFSHTAHSCLMARIQSASSAYQLSKRLQNTTEGRLTDISLNIMRSLRLPLDQAAEMATLWCEVELEVEIEHLSLSAFADDLITQAVAMGKQVIFISDMYLDAQQIRHILEGCGFDMTRVSQLISTADTTLNKRSGTIFPMVEEKFEMTPSGILHIGDSFVSDFRRPIAAGWKAQHLPIPELLLKARIQSHETTCAMVFGDKNFPLPMSKPSL